MLIGILLPAVTRGRDAAEVSACLSRQRQLLIGVGVYAADYDDDIPRGPRTQASFVAAAFGRADAATEDEVASSVVVSAADAGAYFNAHGVLLNGYLNDRRIMFCPGDDTADPGEELQKIRDLAPPVFSSYVYRNLDQVTAGKLSDLGFNDENIEARALFVDSNSVFESEGDTYRTNHGNDPANIAFRDGHAKSVTNVDNAFSLTAPDYFGWTAIEAAYNRIFISGDAR